LSSHKSTNNNVNITGAIVGSLIVFALFIIVLCIWNKNNCRNNKNVQDETNGNNHGQGIVESPSNGNIHNHGRETIESPSNGYIHNHGRETIESPSNGNIYNHGRETVESPSNEHIFNHGREMV
jgi:hypothetical protein